MLTGKVEPSALEVRYSVYKGKTQVVPTVISSPRKMKDRTTLSLFLFVPLEPHECRKVAQFDNINTLIKK